MTDFGPISRKMAVGEVKRIIWPPSRWGPVKPYEEINLVTEGSFIKHSKTMSNDEIYRKYGRPKYNEYEPDNSQIPGWTRGYG